MAWSSPSSGSDSMVTGESEFIFKLKWFNVELFHYLHLFAGMMRESCCLPTSLTSAANLYFFDHSSEPLNQNHLQIDVLTHSLSPLIQEIDLRAEPRPRPRSEDRRHSPIAEHGGTVVSHRPSNLPLYGARCDPRFCPSCLPALLLFEVPCRTRSLFSPPRAVPPPISSAAT